MNSLIHFYLAIYSSVCTEQIIDSIIYLRHYTETLTTDPLCSDIRPACTGYQVTESCFKRIHGDAGSPSDCLATNRCGDLIEEH